MTTMKKIIVAVLMLSAIHVSAEKSDSGKPEEAQEIVADIKIPYERPMGFTVNLGSIVGMTFEGRYLLGLAPNLSLIVVPSYQNTLEIPFYHLEKQRLSVFNIKRLHVGAGIRGHFYEYDSWDGFFIEGLGRVGMVWAGNEDLMWSVIPSIILGYAAVYESGYTVSFGVGLEWEFIMSKPTGTRSEFLQTAYYGITKLPLTGELSIGWTW